MYPNRILILLPLQQDEEISTGNQHDPRPLLLSWIFAVSKQRSCLTELPWWLRGQRICLQCRRHRWHGLDPWIRKIPWRRKWQPTPVFLPGKFYGQGSLVGYSPWGSQRVWHDWVTKPNNSNLQHWRTRHLFTFWSFCVPKSQRRFIFTPNRLGRPSPRMVGYP